MATFGQLFRALATFGQPEKGPTRQNQEDSRVKNQQIFRLLFSKF